MNTASRLSIALLLGSTALAALIVPAPAHADDCLLDRDNDGNVDAGTTDNDGGANSNDDDASLACGAGADATGQFATAVGSNSVANADRTVAIGRIAQATAADAITTYVRAELVETLYFFFWCLTKKQGRPFDRLRANGGWGSALPSPLRQIQLLPFRLVNAAHLLHARLVLGSLFRSVLAL